MSVVHANLLALHLTSTPDSATTHWLRISTRVEVLEARDTARRVRVVSRPDAHPIECCGAWGADRQSLASR